MSKLFDGWCDVAAVGKRVTPFAFAAALMAFTAGGASAAIFVVRNTNDDGPGSLRQAITKANAPTAPDVINFNIPGTGVHTIAPKSQMPTITNPITINGYT